VLLSSPITSLAFASIVPAIAILSAVTLLEKVAALSTTNEPVPVLSLNLRLAPFKYISHWLVPDAP
jgi:hypothetical protein